MFGINLSLTPANTATLFKGDPINSLLDDLGNGFALLDDLGDGLPFIDDLAA